MSRALDVLGGLVLPDGHRWGDTAEPFQWQDARAILDAGERRSYLTRPRGGRKTTDVGGMAIAALLEQLPPASRSYAAAADREQGQLLVDAMAGFVSRTPELGGAITVDTWRATGPNGATLDVMAADAAGAFGKIPHLLIADELAQWPTTTEARRFWEALFSALPKVPTSRLVVITTAGDPAHPAGRLIARAHVDDGWYVHEVTGPLPWVSDDDLAEQRAELSESQFARLHLNRWMASEDRLVDPEHLRACVTLAGPLEPQSGVTYRIGADLGLKNDRTVLSVCHAEAVEGEGARRRRIVLDRQVVFAGTRTRPVALSDVESALLALWRSYNRARLVLDPWQAIGLGQRLSARGVSVSEFSFSSTSVGRLASTLHLLLRDHLLALPDDEALLDELGNVRLRETSPGVVRMDHDPGRHDDRAISLALAAIELVEQGGPSPARATVATGRMPSTVSTVGRVDPMRDAWSLGRVRGSQLPGVAGRR